MWAIILGLIAALGVGGAVAGGGGGGGGSSSSGTSATSTVSAPRLTQQAFSYISPVTALSSLTVANNTDLGDQYTQQRAALNLSGISVRRNVQSDTSLEDGLLPDQALILTPDNQEKSRGLFFNVGADQIKLVTGEVQLDSLGNIRWGLTQENGIRPLEQEKEIMLSSADATDSAHLKYKTFTAQNEQFQLPDGQQITHYNALHLGGAPLRLTTADFGIWEEYRTWANNQQPTGYLLQDFDNIYLNSMRTLLVYDKTAEYQGNRTDTVAFDGTVLVAPLETATEHGPRSVETGLIHLDLNFLTYFLTGSVVMDNEALRTLYNVTNLTGTIAKNVFQIGGTVVDGVPAQQGAVRGGYGKILQGDDGLELIGNFSRQILLPNGNNGINSEEDGKVDYVFGAKEIVRQTEPSGGSTLEVDPNPNISPLVAKAGNTATIWDRDYYAKYLGPVTFSQNGVSVTNETPILDNGVFKQDTENSYCGWCIIGTKNAYTMTKGHLKSTNAYGNYYEQFLGNFSGYAAKDGQAQYLSANLSAGLMLGGEKAGLTLGDFGYQMSWVRSASLGNDSEYSGFYAYDQSALAPQYTPDNTNYTYAGNVLGYASYTENHQSTPAPIQGTAALTLNSQYRTVNGTLLTSLNNQAWHTVNLSGLLTDPAHITFNAVNVSGTPNASISKYQYQGLYTQGDYLSSGQAVLLSNGDVKEMVGDVQLWGENTDGNNLYSYLTFGATGTPNTVVPDPVIPTTYDPAQLLHDMNRTDTVHFDAAALGTAVYESDTLSRSDKLIGSGRLDLDFALAKLTGFLDTKIDGKEYYTFTMKQDLRDGQTYAYTSPFFVTDYGQAIDPSLNLYAFTFHQWSPSGSLHILTGEDGLEILGNQQMTEGNVNISFNFAANETSTTPHNPQPNYSLISALTDYATYPNAVLTSAVPAEFLQIPLGVYLDKKYPGKIFTNSSVIDSALGATVAMTGSSNWGNAWYVQDQRIIGTDSSTYFNDLYVGGSKLGLTASDFGFFTTYHPSHYEPAEMGLLHNYQDFIIYDADRLYNGGRNEVVSLKGNALMIDEAYNQQENFLPVFAGLIGMNINLPTASLYGRVDMEDSQYSIPSFTGTVNGSDLTFASAAVPDLLGWAKLLQGNNGLESVGSLFTNNGSHAYSFGMKEVETPYVEEPEPEPEPEPTPADPNISPLVAKAANVVSIWNSDYYSKYLGPVTFSENGVSVTDEVPTIENGVFAQDTSASPCGWCIVGTRNAYNLTKENFVAEKSNVYKDYYEKDLGTFAGYALKDEKMQYLSADLATGLALGGQKAGLTLGDFGYQVSWVHSPQAGDDSQYSGFYAYDQAAITQQMAPRNMAYTYQGNVLGYASYTENHQSTFAPIEGTISVMFNFVQRNVTGALATTLNNLPWHSLYLQGKVTDASHIQFNSFTLTQTPDTALTKYTYQEPLYGIANGEHSTSGQAVLLEDGDEKEMVGEVKLWGNNLYNDTLYSYLAFGAKETNAAPVQMPIPQMSVMTNPDKYASAVVVRSAVEAEHTFPITVQNGSLRMEGEHPVLENGYLKQETIGNEVRSVMTPYETELDLYDLVVTDPYFDGFMRLSWEGTGLYNGKNYTSQPDNWITNHVQWYDNIGLSGRLTGLTQSDFGYHFNQVYVNEQQIEQQFDPFYIYNANALYTNTNLKDEVSFSGKVLGNVSYVYNDSGAVSQTLRGTNTFNLNLATRALTGTIDTILLSSPYVTYNVAGQVNTDGSLTLSQVTADSSKITNKTSNMHRFKDMTLTTAGSGKLLQGDNEKLELVGLLQVKGENLENYELYNYLSFGAVENDRTPYAEPEPSPMPFEYVSPLAAANKYNFVRIRVKNDDHKDDRLDIANNEVIWHDGKTLVQNGEIVREKTTHSDGHTEYETVEEPLDLHFTSQTYQKSDEYADYFYIPNAYHIAALYDKEGKGNKVYVDYVQDYGLILGGRLIGLTQSDFGTNLDHTIVTVPSQSITEDRDPFYMYNQNALANLSQIARDNNAVHFDGHVLGGAKIEYDTDDIVDDEGVLVTGTASLDINLLTHALTGNLNTFINGLQYNKFSLFGSAYNSGFTLSSVNVDASSVDASLARFKFTSGTTKDNAFGSIVNGDDGKLELVGYFKMEGDNAYGEVENEIAFGAKEVTPTPSLTPDYSLISALTDFNQYPNAVLTSAAPSQVQTFPLATYISSNQPATVTISPWWLDSNLAQQTVSLTAADLAANTDYYKLYSKTVATQWQAPYDGTWKEVTNHHDLYFGGEKVGLQVSDFGFSNTYRPAQNGAWDLTNYQDFIVYDSNYLYKGGRNDIASLSGHVFMIDESIMQAYAGNALPVETGSIAMNLDLANATLNGHIDMNNNQYSISSFNGAINGSELTFWSNVVTDLEGYGKLLEGPQGLESVGVMGTAVTENIGHTYVFGAKEQ